MAVRSPDERIDRLGQVVQMIAEGQVSLQKLVSDLATETRRGFDQVAQQFRETDARSRALDERLDKIAHEGAERSRALDERVDRLVSAIGEMVRRQDETRRS